MQNNIKCLLVCLVLLPFIGMAQVDNSPFSAFGIGNLHSDDLAFYQGFGGLGASYYEANHINIQNPATYATLMKATYELGVSAKYFQVSDDNNSETNWLGNLDYIALAFPLINPINDLLDNTVRDYKYGMSFVLKPHSTVGYNISSVRESPTLGTYQNNFEGNGGLFKFLWGNAMQYKSLSVGANVGYLFGNISAEQRLTFEESRTAFGNYYSTDYNVNGFIWDAGVSYNIVLNKAALMKDKGTKKKEINIGFTGRSAQNFSTKSNFTQSVADASLNSYIEQLINPEQRALLSDYSADTLISAQGLAGQGRLPAEIGIGATYFYDYKYSVGINFDYGAWSTYKNSVGNETLSDSWKLSIGGSYRPDVKSFNNYFKRVSYKYGVFYQRDPQIIDNIQVTDTGFNLGASFPFYYQRKISHINAAFRFGVKGTGTPIGEMYGKVTVGFTFNDDEWFIKRKYN